MAAQDNGILAQLGEHLPYKQGVTGSSPVSPIHMARWLNWLERPVHTREVEGSSPSLATITLQYLLKGFLFLYSSNVAKHSKISDAASYRIDLVLFLSQA